MKTVPDIKPKTINTAKGLVEYAEIGAGPPLISIHGGFGGYDQSILIARDYAKEYRLIGVSRPGYLGTPINTGQSFEQQADAVAALMDALDIKKANVTCMSAGGPVGVHLAIRRPQRLNALLLVSAVSKTFNHADKAGKMEKLILSTGVAQGFISFAAERLTTAMARQTLAAISTYNKQELDAAVDFIISDPHRRRTLIDVVKTLASFDRRRQGLWNDMEELSKIDCLPVENITVPTLVVHGKKDAAAGFENAQYSAENISNARLIAMDRASHLPFLSEGWDAAVREIRGFLDANNS